MDSENPKVHYNLGLVFLHIRDYEKCMQELKEASRLEPNNQEVLMLMNQARSLYPQGWYKYAA